MPAQNASQGLSHSHSLMQMKKDTASPESSLPYANGIGSKQFPYWGRGRGYHKDLFEVLGFVSFCFFLFNQDPTGLNTMLLTYTWAPQYSGLFVCLFLNTASIGRYF